MQNKCFILESPLNFLMKFMKNKCVQKQLQKRFAIYEAQTTFSQIRINKSEEQNSL